MEFSGTLETNSSWRLPFATMRGAERKLMVMSDHLGQPDHQGTHEEEGNVLQQKLLPTCIRGKCDELVRKQSN